MFPAVSFGRMASVASVSGRATSHAAPAAPFGDEAELVAAMVVDDARAWREFQQRYDRLILRCITKVTRRFTAIAQDDVREIYATLLVSLVSNDKHKLRTFDPARGNRFTSWIGLLAVHCAYDYLRALRREPSMGSLAEAADLACELPDPFEQTERRQRAAIAAAMLSELSARDRDFAELYFGEGMDPNDIASAMNISVKTVYSKKHKIQARLGAYLAGSHVEGLDAADAVVTQSAAMAPASTMRIAAA